MRRGSVTVFLCFMFLLLFSLLGAAFENARVLSSGGYMRTAADAAAMTVFGSYNRELYEEYGLFAYGGYGGLTVADLEEAFSSVLLENRRVKPKNAKKEYCDLYQIKEVECSVEEAAYLSEHSVLCGQIKAYLKGAAVKDVKEELLEKISGGNRQHAESERLELAKEYEEGRFDASEESSDEKKRSPSLGEGEVGKEKSDKAKGNPLKSFIAMMKNGLLELVCDSANVSEGRIEESDSGEEKRKDKETQSASAYMQDIIENSVAVTDASLLENAADQLSYIAYAQKQFSSYTNERNRTAKYGLEYLLKGACVEKDNLISMVTKLIGTRTLLNFLYIVSDPVLQEKSFATATVLAGFTGMPPVIQAVQYLILLILAFEEACVDVTALLEGNAVPLIKTKENMKMSYEEICLASKSLFASKAKVYRKEKPSAGNITYQQYLMVFLLSVDSQTLHARTCRLIQSDLRQRYNQSFCMDTAVCGCRYEVLYTIPYIFQRLPFAAENLQGKNIRSLEVKYAYKNK